MEYRKPGQSDLTLSAITFGAWAVGGWMWGGAERADAVSAIRTAFDLGVTSIDTAPAYGQGTSEEIVGEALTGIPREKVQIITKYGLRWDLAKGQFYFKSKNNSGEEIDIYKYAGYDSVIQECEQSLRRLKTDYIDLYQIHWPDPTTPIAETMGAVDDLIRQGKVRFAGVCNYDVDQLEEASRYVSIISNQVPYSMVKRHIESSVVPYCIANNKGILAYSPLERGLLTGKIKPGHKFNEGDHRATGAFFTDDNVRRTNAFLEKIRPIATRNNLTLSQLVLRWTLQQPGITIALAGARNAVQAKENARAGEITLSDDDVSAINTHLADLQLTRN